MFFTKDNFFTCPENNKRSWRGKKKSISRRMHEVIENKKSKEKPEKNENDKTVKEETKDSKNLGISFEKVGGNKYK